MSYLINAHYYYAKDFGKVWLLVPVAKKTNLDNCFKNGFIYSLERKLTILQLRQHYIKKEDNLASILQCFRFLSVCMSKAQTE